MNEKILNVLIFDDFFFFFLSVILCLRITLEWFASMIYEIEVVCGNGGWGK